MSAASGQRLFVQLPMQVANMLLVRVQNLYGWQHLEVVSFEEDC